MSAAVAIDLEQIERRAKVVELAKTGKPYRAIGAALGVNASTVARDIAAWAAETKPTSEQTEELRKLQCETIDALHEKLWPRLETDDYLAVTDRLVKLMDRKAKLMGIDLERGINVTMVTAEALASYLGWDDEPVVEGQAVEITEGSTP